MFLNQRTFIFLSIIIVAIVGVGRAEALNYRSYVFGTYEIILFSYEDGTDLEVSGFGQTLWSGTLNKGQHKLVQKLYGPPVPAVYRVEGSNQFAVLTGHITGGNNSYYAMDQNGRAVSGEFYTYVTQKKGSYGSQKFIVFAYEDGTELTLEYADPNEIYQEVVTDFPLDKGENWSSEDLPEKYVHVASNKPVSALSCYDTGYFVPSANGKFSGTKFYTYIGKTKYAGQYVPQDLVVTAYDDDTLVIIADSNEPGVVKWQGTIHADEPHVQRFPDGLNEPLCITSTQPVQRNRRLFACSMKITGFFVDVISKFGYNTHSSLYG